MLYKVSAEFEYHGACFFLFGSNNVALSQPEGKRQALMTWFNHGRCAIQLSATSYMV